jgi:hypothetical protein
VRKIIAVVLAVASLTFGAPAAALAQNIQSGSVTGELVDAGGRALPGQRVELVQAGRVMQSTTTGTRGTFTFANVAPGDYIVRMQANGQTAGVRTTVHAGLAANAMIVAPSAALPSAISSAGVVAIVAVIAGTAATIAVVKSGS